MAHSNREDLNLKENEKMELIQNELNKIYEKALAKQDRLLRNYLIKNLKELGIDINDDDELNKFARERIHVVDYPNHEHELYIIDNAGNKTLIGIYSTKVNVDLLDNKVNIKIG